MHTLTRTVRFAVGSTSDARGVNGFAGNPRVTGLDRHYELQVSCRGDVDPVTGYLIDIKTIDRAVRDRVVPLFNLAIAANTSPAAVLTQTTDALRTQIKIRLIRFFSLVFRSRNGISI
jgi:hypothetical protein